MGYDMVLKLIGSLSSILIALQGVIVGLPNTAQVLQSQSGLLVAGYDNRGLVTLSYNGVKVVDAVANPGDAFVVREFKIKKPDGTITSGWGGEGYTSVWDSANKSLALTYSWGKVITTYVQSGNNLNISIAVQNTSTVNAVQGVSIFPFMMRFPQLPIGFGDATNFNLHFNGDGPSVLPVDYGSGMFALINEDTVKNLYLGFAGGSSNGSAVSQQLWIGSTPLFYLPSSFPFFDRPISPGQTDTYNISLRFAPSRTSPVSLASDVYQNYGQNHPFSINWSDNRPIGYLMMAPINPPSPWPKNPRGWFNDSSIDVTTPTGLVLFQKRLLSYADTSIAVLKNMNAQGMIVWDIEGEKSPNTTYMCDPTQLSTAAPEMDGIADVFFKKFRDAGFKVGVCVRPQVLNLAADTQQQASGYSQMVQILNTKIGYAKQRWGATLFYVDSNDNFDADVFRQVQNANPDVLIIPEQQKTAHFAYSAPYSDLRLAATTDFARTPDEVRAAYPNAFGVINVNVGDLTGYTNQIIQGVSQGDILLFEAWYSNPSFQDNLKNIYERAGISMSPLPVSPPSSQPALSTPPAETAPPSPPASNAGSSVSNAAGTDSSQSSSSSVSTQSSATNSSTSQTASNSGQANSPSPSGGNSSNNISASPGFAQIFSQASCSVSNSGTGVLTRTLYRSLKGDDVKTLQIFLINQGYLEAISLGTTNATGFFGLMTESALKKFQKENGIVSSGTPLSTGYGNAGPMTRAKINSLLSACSSKNLPASTKNLQEQVKILQAQVNELLLKLQKSP